MTFGALLFTSALGVATTLCAAPASASPAVPTLAVKPSVVQNGDMVTLSGTATCSVVVIDAHPGASGAWSVGPLIARVTNGAYSIRIRLPVFVEDPEKPGLNSDQAFNAACSGSVEPSSTSYVRVTGIELPSTGSDTRPLAAIGTAGIIGGLLAVAATRRRTRHTL
jgi:LPXTG-motif cell wall-anchored protein